MIRHTTLLILSLILGQAFLGAQDFPPTLSKALRPAEPQQVRQVILLIGDGMGLSQITAGMYANGNRLQLERFKVIGLHKSHSSSHLVTDSAAGATAFSCGIKTFNHAIGVTPDTMPCRTIMQEAKARGWATGMATTSTIVHATPASFIAHNRHRNNYEEIAEAFPGSGIDYFVGGGLRFFRNRKNDERDLTAELEAQGYYISNYFAEEYDQVVPDPARPFGFLTAYEDPLTAESGRNYLVQATEQGLQFLSRRSDQGLFFLVEGAQIDWGGHANNGPYIIAEMIDFDRTIGAALDFAERTPGTLVIVTADHEAGGCAIQPESTFNELKFAFTTTGHTGTMIPVFAYGPGAELFGGIYENTAIYHKIMALLGW